MSKQFERSISVWQGMALYTGAVVGSGILILPGMTAGVAGNNALLSWLGMVVLSIPLAFTFAILAREFPSAGGVSTFVEKAFGRYMGALIGWFYFMAAAAGQFIVPLTGGIYVAYAYHLPSWAAFVTASALLMGAVTSNYFGLRTSGKVQVAVSGLVIFILLSVIILAIPHIGAVHLTPKEPLRHLSSIGAGAMMIFWSFFGWEAITSLAPEFKNPERDIVRSTIGALVIVGVLYLGIAGAVVGTHAYSSGVTTLGKAMNSASLAQVMSQFVGSSGGKFTAILALLICLGTTNAFVASISRLAYSLSHERLAPSWLDSIDEHRATPQRAVLLVGALAGAGLALTGVLHLGMNQLVYIPNSLGIATYVMGTAAGVKLLTSWTGKAASGIACVLCISAYPFVGAAIWIPVTVGAACALYVSLRGQHERRSLH